MSEPDRIYRESPLAKRRPYGRKAFPRGRPHGTRSTYVAGCGCEECTRAERVYSREVKRRRLRRVVRELAGY